MVLVLRGRVASDGLTLGLGPGEPGFPLGSGLYWQHKLNAVFQALLIVDCVLSSISCEW